jgi:hypothetical protein
MSLDKKKSASALINVIGDINFSQKIQGEQFYEKIEPYFSDDIEDVKTALETLIIKGGKNKVIIVTTTKLYNLRFRIKDLLLETLKVTVKLEASKNNILAFVLVVLEFLQKVSGLMEYTLSECEAKVLIEMCFISNERAKITIDKLFVALENSFNQAQILRSLEILEKLSCIRHGTDEISLVEEILFLEEE